MTIPTTTMYRIRRYSCSIELAIECVQVTRTTKAFVYFMGKRGDEYRESFANRCTEILPTWEEAHARLLQIAEEDLGRAHRELDRARSRREDIAGMKKP
jgi:hypothetical protein